MIRALALLALIAAAPAAVADPLRVVAFAGASNLPFWAGQENGAFSRAGVEVSLDITPNSVEMARNLEAGRYDLALTSVDNIVAYDEGEGETGLPPADFIALFGVDDGMLSLVAAPGITTVAQAGTGPVSVDAATTGFAFVLRAILAQAGVTDPIFVTVGGGAQRLAALLAGQQPATLLNTPLDVVAESHGFHALARATDTIGPYQGIVAAIRRDRVQSDKARLVAFTRAFHASVAWLADPAHRADGTALLRAHMQDLSPDSAATAYDALLDPAGGIHRDLAIDPAGMRTVLALRSRYALPHKDLAEPGRYTDDAIRATALETRP